MFVSIPNKDTDSVTDGSSLSPYLWLSAEPGHFGSLRGKVTPLICYSAIGLETEPWTTHPTGLLQLYPAERQLDMGVSLREADAQRKVRVGGGKKPVKSYEICPLNNQRPNQFVQRPRDAGGLQRNVWSGRSLSAHPSPYLRLTHNSLSLEKRWPEGMGLRRGKKTFLCFFFPFFHSFLVFDRCCT